MNLLNKKSPLVHLTVFLALAAFLAIPSNTQAQRPGSPKAKAKAHHKKEHHHNAQHNKEQHNKAQHNRAQHNKAQQKRAHARRAAHHHYKHLPKRGAVVTTTPSGVVIVKHKGANYHYHNGVFYKPKGAASFYIARAPIGARVKVLPTGHKKVFVGKRPYVYYYGTFYKKAPDTNEYEVVDAPVGAEVDALPEGYQMEEIDGVVYYTLDDVKYMEKDANGEPVYEVVE
ncbi:MAG: hypothetical protein JKY52_19120 [Flavobacteriales bacterium]|nr:hypothetical protein [Flavobacteriales bacterium]